MSGPQALPPRPVADRDTQPFWDGVAERRLLVQRCGSCERWVWQPKPICNRCGTPDPNWTEVNGAACVVSWTTLHPPVLPVWQDALPFTILLVELADAPGVRMLGQLVDDASELVRGDGSERGIDFGAALSLRWRTDEAGTVLPAWTVD